jgi:hypothetical protein
VGNTYNWGRPSGSVYRCDRARWLLDCPVFTFLNSVDLRALIQFRLSHWNCCPLIPTILVPITMSEVDADRKRRASEMDSAVVAPKKKFLAAQAEAAASDSTSSKAPPPSPGGVVGNAGAALSEGRADARPVVTSSHATSYSTRDNAPAGARSADDDENVRFQNTQLYAANQAHRNEIGRLTKQIESLQSQQQNCTESVACIQRHWLMLIDELKRTFQRLERTKSTMDHTIVNDTLQAFFQNQVIASQPPQSHREI